MLFPTLGGGGGGGQVKTSNQDIVHLSFCRIVFVYIFLFGKREYPIQLLLIVFELKLA